MINSPDHTVCADLSRLLAEQGDTRGVSDLQAFGEGHSGFTFSVRVGDATAILRLSPPGARIAGPADVGRQGRIMSAIHSVGAPAPAVIACSSDGVVDGRAFALMERAPGAAWSDVVDSLGSAALARAALTALAGIQRINVSCLAVATELDTFSPALEVDRWAGLVPRTPAALHPVMNRLRDALVESAPSQREVCLVHGDYHYGNLLFDHGQVTAVLDWEIASLGDPLVDVASLAVASHRRRYAPEPNPTGGLDVAPRLLADWSGADADLLAWFFAQSCFKYAAIIGYNLELHRRGKRQDPIYEQLQRTMAGLPADALAVLTSGIDALAQTPVELVSR